MNIVQILMSISFMVIIGCSPKKEQVNHFSSSNDTIILKAEKVKGLGVFSAGAGEIYFKDTIEEYDYPVIFPKNITDIKLAWQYVDMKPFEYGYSKKGEFDKSTFLKYVSAMKIDTFNIPSIKDNSISIMSGRRGNDTIFIVDENNNKDFRDDSVRLYYKMDWKTTSKLIKCKYKIYNGQKMVEDSSWVNIGNMGNKELLFFVSHHLESTFSIDNKNYQIGVVDRQSNFCFDEPILALTSQNGIKKDTLLEKDLLKKGECLKIKDTYYRFDEISNDGKFITLIKEKDFNNIVGTQVGMLAPDFNCHSIDGDFISLKDYKGKYFLLINVSACYSEKSSYECYKELTETYNGKFDFLGIDNSPVTLRNNIRTLNLSGKFAIVDENVMLKAYRPEFCSRTCYLINPEGRIVDKFKIFDWKSNLANTFGVIKASW